MWLEKIFLVSMVVAFCFAFSRLADVIIKTKQADSKF
jgi:hypothetical protein